jgi:ClpP class serine protease
MNKPTLLARIFGRSKNPVVASLASAALNRPLLVHQGMGEALISSYLHADVTSADTELGTGLFNIADGSAMVVEAAADGSLSLPISGDETDKPGGLFAVINISGGLVNRPMPGPSGGGPQSYVALRDAFDDVMEDPRVEAVVLRIESPGGMASGNFDLVDRIFARRGEKPVHALVDDYAYSAAFAIATACDRIWISRTGGVGSVGVVGYHIDWSKAAEMSGAKVTAIYAGAKKVDFSPHFPLSESAKEDAQLEINGLYSLFANTVARNLGMNVDAVISTQAGTYNGQAAIDIGFATDLGTWDDLVSHLGAQNAKAPATPGDDDDGGDQAQAEVPVDGEPGATVSTMSAAQATPTAVSAVPSPAEMDAAYQAAVLEADIPADITRALQRRGRLDQDAPTALAYAQGVVDACAAGGLPEMAADYIKTNTDISQVRKQLAAAKAEDQEIVTALPADAAAKQGLGANAKTLNPASIYANRRP